MNIYHYQPETGEYMRTVQARIDPRESRIQGHDVYLIPACATSVAPPQAEEGMAQVFDLESQSWSQVEDHRGKTLYNTSDGQSMTMSELGEVPDGYTLEAPSEDMLQPQYVDGEWIETAIVFQGVAVSSKADVDAITRQRIVDLGEEKAKTEKIIAGVGECPLWDEFIAQRAIILQEGEDCISANGF